MFNLIVFIEQYTNGYNVDLLNLLSLFIIILGIYVIITKNPILSILFLIGLFAGASLLLIILDLSFIALAYLIVYIGAVSILFLFIVMLINVRISELSIDNLNSIPLAILIGISFNYLVNDVLPYMMLAFNNLLYHFNIITRLANVTSVS